MKNLRDIEVKSGDKVYFADGQSEIAYGWADAYKNYEEIVYGKIIKIERPVKYETIYEAPKQILDKQEKEYLENVIRPFKDRVEGIVKFSACLNKKEYIEILIQADTDIVLPFFKAGAMYKGMKTMKKYTIEELGLFGGE